MNRKLTRDQTEVLQQLVAGNGELILQINGTQLARTVHSLRRRFYMDRVEFLKKYPGQKYSYGFRGFRLQVKDLTVIKLALGMVDTASVLVHGQLVQLDGRDFHAGSARGYALQYKEDGDAAEARAIEHGHATHWLNPDATVICNDTGYYARKDAERAAAPKLSFGQIVSFEGKLFQIQHDFNRNAKLVKVPS